MKKMYVFTRDVERLEHQMIPQGARCHIEPILSLQDNAVSYFETADGRILPGINVIVTSPFIEKPIGIVPMDALQAVAETGTKA